MRSIATIPPKSKKKSRKRFQKATIYAKGAIDDPQIREQYDAVTKKKKGLTAYNVTVADFYNAPDIEEIDLSGYAGDAGDEIKIIASDDFKVISVHVEIINADGENTDESDGIVPVCNLLLCTVLNSCTDNNLCEQVVLRTFCHLINENCCYCFVPYHVKGGNGTCAAIVSCFNMDISTRNCQVSKNLYAPLVLVVKKEIVYFSVNLALFSTSEFLPINTKKSPGSAVHFRSAL
ncbi:MAG: hypothetical protein LBE04_07850 [Prevotellaceae bacterium]|nr:hypothetical protein [Prevotellaceae bacterium]